MVAKLEDPYILVYEKKLSSLHSVSKMRQEDLLPCTAAFELGDLAGDRARGAGGARHHDRFTDVDLADLRDSAL